MIGAPDRTGAKIKSRRELLDDRARKAFEDHRGRYGAPRIHRELADRGHRYDRKTIAKSLRRQGLRARAAQRFKAITNSNRNLAVAPNLLEQDFAASGLNEKRVQDISYLPTGEGCLYLATVIDLHNREFISWAMDERMKAGLVCGSLTDGAMASPDAHRSGCA